MSAARGAAIILSAGMSSRMQKFKPLLPLGPGTIVERVIGTFAQNDVDVYLVVGHNKQEIIQSVEGRDVTVVENPAYERGMLTSIQAGVRRLCADHKWFFVMPVDIPLVRPATVRRLMEEADKHFEAIVYPVFVGQRGHPVLVPARLTQTILDFHGSGGLRTVLSQDANSVEVAVPDANVVFDVDSPKDYWDVTDRFRRIHAPTKLECDVILNDLCGVPPHIRAHCLKVEEAALLIGESLCAAGRRLDLDSVRAAAALHDLAKGQRDHEAQAARILRTMGFDRIAEIVATHTDLPDERDASLETKVVFIADKFVKGAQLVTIEERYENSSRAFSITPDIEGEITRRRARALGVKRELELLLGRSLEDVLFRKEAHSAT
jgi:CTP:molybdopterin cytidylyltransferase MocA